MNHCLYCSLTALALFFSATSAWSQGTPISTPTGLWEFDNAAALGQATLGSGLTITGTTPAFSATLSDGSKTLTGAITTVGGTANRLSMPIPAGGNGGGSFTNEYTLLFDIFSPSGSRTSYRSLFQTNTGNSNDGDYFIRNSDDKLGTAALGYSANALPEAVWKRVVIVGDLGSSYKVYVDGALFHTHTSQGVDGRYSLEGQLLLFADDTSENAALNVGAVAFWKQLLTAAEIAALGAAGAPIQGAALPNNAPVITEGATASLTAQVNSSTPITLNATDADANTLTWSVTGAATQGNAVVTTSTSNQAVITYTPSTDYLGSDSFTVQVTDGQATDSIVVNVTVQGSIVTIAEGASIALVTPMNGTKSFTLNASDSQSNALTWSILTPAAHGAAQVTGNHNTSGTFSYTPTAGYLGSDAFTIRASNGSTHDDIVVNASVAFTTGNPRVFYSQNFNAATLQAEVTTSGERRMPAGDNTPIWNTPEGSGLNLTSGANVFLNPVNDRIAEFAGFNFLRADFWSNGDDQGRSTAFAPGTNVIAVA
ncbi:MAG: Ig-like domain-containing protein, partial [Roseimicrobium sp.]